MAKVAVIGTGYWGQNLVRNYHALGALKTVCDVNMTALDSVRFAYPQVQVTPQYSDVLDDSEIQGVVIATPAAMHYSFAREALERGKDVYVEKPLALQRDHAEHLVELARSKNRLLMVGHLLHYHPAFIRLKEIVASGQLGKLQYLYSNRLSLGRVRREENSLWSFAPHDISMLLALTQAMPERVSAFGANVLQESVADVTNTFLAFPGGVCGHIFVSWLHPFKEHKLVVVAEKGMAVFEDTQPWDRKLALYPHSVKWEGGVPVPEKSAAQHVTLEQAEPLAAECRHFLNCLEDRSQPVTDGQEGLRVLRVLELAQRSLQNQSMPESMSAEKRDYYAHETAWVDQPCSIGPGTKIWHFSHVLKGARLGRDCSLGQNVSIANDVVIGDNVKIQNNVSVYTGTVVEDNVFLGPSAVFTNVTNPRSEIVRRGLYEKTLIRRGASIGANATIVCGITVGRYAFVAAGAVVAKDVPDYALMVGVPARRVAWVSRHGHRMQPDDQGKMHCPESGLTYRLSEGAVRCVEIDEEAALPDEMRVGSRSYDSLKPTKETT